MKSSQLIVALSFILIAGQTAAAADKVVVVHHSERRLIAFHSQPAQPYWYYHQTLPWGTHYTTVADRGPERCYFSWAQARDGRLIPRKGCETVLR